MINQTTNNSKTTGLTATQWGSLRFFAFAPLASSAFLSSSPSSSPYSSSSFLFPSPWPMSWSQVSVKLTAKTKTVWGFCTADKETKAKGRESVYCKSVLLRSLENATVEWSTRLCWLYKTVVVVSHFSFTFAMTDWFFDCLLLCVLTSFPVPVTLTNKKRNEIIKKH